MECANSELERSEFTPTRFARLKRFVTSPFASICIFSPKNHGVWKSLPKVKLTLLYPGPSYVFRPRFPCVPAAGTGNADAGKIPFRKAFLG